MNGLDVFNRPESKWTEDTGPNRDIVISSRVRLARNIKDLPFPYLLSESQETQIMETTQGILGMEDVKAEIGQFNFIDLGRIPPLQRWVLVEKHLISPQHAQSQGHKGIAIRKDEAVSIMINEEDHFRIQCLLPGMQLFEAWKIATQVDDALEQKMDFAFDPEKGYLTSCPTNVGTGMRASVMIHLPGLVMTKRANQILSTLTQFGLTVRGMYGEGTEALGNLFQVSNQVTLGLSEEDTINHLTSMMVQIIEQERYARSALRQEASAQIEDRVWRSYGILSNARIINSQEATALLSDLRLGTDLGIIQGINPRIFNILMVLTQPAFLQKISEQELNPFARDLKRAEIIRKKLTGGEQNV